jgi:simple sugar transport system permease protein
MIGSLLLSTIRVSTPLVFGAAGGVISERGGVVCIALEGFMLMGAFAAAVVTYWTHSPWIGFAGGMLAGMLMALLYGLAVVFAKANQIVAGMAINMLALGLTPSFCKALFDETGSTPQLPSHEQLKYAPAFIAWLAIVLIWLFFKYSPAGLRLSFAGEQPDALDTAGISVTLTRWLAVAASGLLAGAGGATLSICLSSSFSRNMTAGRGFIALAAVIFGKWRPCTAALACLFFGFTEALQIRLQGSTIFGISSIPPQIIQVLPYVATVLALAGFVGHSRAPKALGLPFGRR